MSVRAFVLLALVIVASATVPAGAQEPVRLLSGEGPLVPEQTVGRGEVIFEVEIGADGTPVAVLPVRTEEPFGQVLLDAVSTWRFSPGTPGRVMVAALFRPPVLLGPSLDSEPEDLAAPSPDLPSPFLAVMPEYPLTGFSDESVVVEVQVDADGNVTGAEALGGAPAFAQAALDAAAGWAFRPARVDGRPAPSVAYLVFGFRRPVI